MIEHRGGIIIPINNKGYLFFQYLHGDGLEDIGIKKKMATVYLGINAERFRPPESKILAKEKLGLNPNNIVIGYLGRFGREKDIPTLYNAFRKVHSDRPNTTLLLVGGEMKPFENMENIKVIGSVDNPVPYYHAMDIYVLPSLTETTSLTTMEAMACGLKPVIHNYVGARCRYPEKYLWNTIPEFVNMVREDDYNSKEYRKLIEKEYSLNDQLNRIKRIIDSMTS